MRWASLLQEAKIKDGRQSANQTREIQTSCISLMKSKYNKSFRKKNKTVHCVVKHFTDTSKSSGGSYTRILYIFLN